MDVRCSPMLPTYPSCKVVLRATSCSTDTFHCHEFGMIPPVVLDALGDTDGLANGVGASMRAVGVCADDEWCGVSEPFGETHRFPLEELAGADCALLFLPSPRTSQAMPTRGAIL